MKLAILAGVTLAFTTVAAFAGDQFAGMYGDTVHQKDANGKASIIYINANGTWEQRRDGKTMRGTYTWKDATHFCIVVTEPAPKPGEQAEQDCDNEITGDHKVGDTWTMTDSDGTTTLSITAGRQ